MAFSTQPDSTFFVEAEEPSFPRLNSRDAAKMLARNKQEMIANELSRLACDEYLEDIMQHMRHMEDETLPDANLIDMQREIQWFMRPYLIDFLIEAHAAFSLLPETLFLTVNLLDRYCSKRVVYKQHYQLVGCAALLIAAKYGDKKDRVPQINELNNMCCGLYDAGMFTQMEMHVLNTLEWNIGHPTVDFFTQLIVAEERDDREVEHMAAYICEIALYHRDFVSTKPSTMARSSLALARAILARPEVNDGEWDHVENVTLLTLSQNLHQPSVTLSRKYSSPQFSRVSGKLADFLAQQAAITRRQAGPPSPPTEPALTTKHANIYSTPQKGHGAVPGVADGYLTPPITPDGACFGVNGAVKDYQVPPRCPVTPSPQPHVAGYPSQQQHVAQYATYFDGSTSHMVGQ
ncbi:putative g2 mitotic-specific cyclin-b1 protein [Phaeoacremonium minimum UCRPA7]|uniref:Putative g2 mitotic-specific cyclin-b1 protein n=1 Tax=Phaeoacremonium minimum (strain UCR-PA7) TaxID=1286976 RepID=R8BMT3_PHAM7|nr:putative g2 mitotic-specific cyclin-b1 protein [Phaeoacremonium minimum UCRPA7]EOO00708.1 putative g2 mitotic-specific cyclin-b1 protein [Phaeoacremonium minimum UCRPA7]